MIKKYEIVRKSDFKTLYVLESGEAIFCDSCSTLFSLPVAKSFMKGLGLSHKKYFIHSCEKFA